MAAMWNRTLVEDVAMPPMGLLLGSMDFSKTFTVLKEGRTAGPYATIAAANIDRK
jgi:large conductance mechanosensitive channel